MRPVLVVVAAGLWLVMAQAAAAAPTVTGALDPSTVPAGGDVDVDVDALGAGSRGRYAAGDRVG